MNQSDTGVSLTLTHENTFNHTYHFACSEQASVEVSTLQPNLLIVQYQVAVAPSQIFDWKLLYNTLSDTTSYLLLQVSRAS